MQKYYAVARDYLLMTVGALMVAASINLFLAPNNVIVGGVTGVALMLRTLFDTPVGIVTLVFNIPLFIIGFRRLGGLVFGIRTLYATVVVSFGIDLLAPYMKPVTADPLLYTLYGGLLDGLGTGLVFRARGTTGGIDIVARLLEQRFAIQPGQSMLAMNAAVFGGSLLFYGPEKTLYAVLAAFAGSLVLDYTLAAGRSARQALIITNAPDAVTQSLLHDLGRGVTVLEGYGGYTGIDRAVLLCVVGRAEISVLKELVSRIDARAFVIVGEVSEVLGEGFRPFANAAPQTTPPTLVPLTPERPENAAERRS